MVKQYAIAITVRIMGGYHLVLQLYWDSQKEMLSYQPHSLGLRYILKYYDIILWGLLSLKISKTKTRKKKRQYIEICLNR